DAEDRSGSIADKQRPVVAEREAAGDAEVARERLDGAVVADAVDGAFEAARDEETIVRIDRHRRRVDDSRRERFARAVGADAEDRDRHLLTARAAVGDVEIAVAVENGVVDLM